MPQLPSTTPTLTPARLRALVGQLEEGLLQRETAVRLSLLAALAGEHVLLIGPPGTAKSELARRLHRAFAEARYFERLLTRFSTPEELFGPLSLKALEDDRYERLTDGFLPTAGIAFLDEVFKANSAILNALLTLLNERAFDNGSGRLPTPLISVIAASNEGPADEGLQAFFDRFLLRVPVAPVDDAGFVALLRLHERPLGAVSGEAVPLDAAEHGALAEAAARVGLSAAAVTACQQLRTWLRDQGRSLSDRRWRQWVDLMRTAAASEGRAEVDELDLWLLPYVVADAPAEVEPLAQWFQATLMQAAPQDAPWLSRAVEAFERQLELEQSARDDADADSAAGKLALARAIGGGVDSADGGSPGMLRVVTTALESHLRRRFSPVHIAARVAQVDEVLAQVEAALTDLTERRQALAVRLTDRLWWPPALKATLLEALDHSAAVLTGLRIRLQGTRAGFASLPLDVESLAQTPPAPVALDAQPA